MPPVFALHFVGLGADSTEAAAVGWPFHHSGSFPSSICQSRCRTREETD